MNRTIIYIYRCLLILLLLLAQNVLAQENPLNITTAIDTSYEAGKRAYREEGNYDKALILFKQSLEERRAIHGEISVPVGNVYTYIGLIYKKLGFLDTAIYNYKKSEDIFKQIDGVELRSIAIVHMQLSLLSKIAGDYNNALSYLRNTERIIIQNNLTQTPLHEVMLRNFAEIYREMGEYRKALDYIHRAQKIYSEDYREIDKKNIEGILHLELKDYSGALELFEFALKLYDNYYGEDYIERYNIYINIASVYFHTEYFDNALKYYELALEMISDNLGNKNDDYSYVLNYIGNAYIKKSEKANSFEQFLTGKRDNLLTALKYFQRSLIAISTNFDVNDIYINPDIDQAIYNIQMLDALKGKGESFKKLAMVEKSLGKKEDELKFLRFSLEAYELSLDLIDLIRNGFQSKESMMILAENEHYTHFETCEIAAAIYELTNKPEYFEKSFQFSERGKSASFLASLKDLKALDFGGIPDSLLRKEKNLKSELAAYNEFLFGAIESEDKDSAKIMLWEAKVFELEQKYEKLVALFEDKYPDYHSFKHSDRVVSVNEIQSRLKRREAIIEYVVKEPEGEETGEVVSFFITKNNYQIKRTKIDSTYNSSIDTFLGFLKSGQVANTSKKEFVEYTDSAYKLYNLLIAPFESQIKGNRVVCVPDGKLSYLPFDALISEAADTSRMDFRNLEYLVKDFAISYSYSATLLYDYFKKGIQADKSLIAYAPSYANSPDIDVDSVRANHEVLLPLPGAKLEVDGITEMISGDVFEGKNATETSFKKNAGEYDILHLAMHTVINDSLPMYSKLVFGGDENGENNGFLDTHEIYNLKLKARLAVLSACKTGIGHLRKGEGVMSLARGFLYAGCPSIIMTLWNVEDESSSKLMIEFYKNLLDGFPKDEALRRAKLSHLEMADPLRAHPYYWLGYVAVGDQTPLYNTKMPYFIVLIVLLLAIFFTERYLSVRKKQKSI